MKPPIFEYFRADSVEHAVSLLGEHGPDAKLLAGGQSLIPAMNFRLARPTVLVDVNWLHPLDFICEEHGGVRVGALTRHQTLCTSPVLARRLPVLQEAAGQIGHRAIRNRGTLGGSFAHHDPASEMPAIAQLLNAVIRVQGPDGERDIPAAEFFMTWFTTSIDPAEMVISIFYPDLLPQTSSAFLEITRRKGDFALVGAGVTLALDEDGKCTHFRVVALGVSDVALLPPESLLTGRQPTEEAIRAVSAAVMEAMDPEDDLHATAAYKRDTAGVLVRRAIYTALERREQGANHA